MKYKYKPKNKEELLVAIKKEIFSNAIKKIDERIKENPDPDFYMFKQVWFFKNLNENIPPLPGTEERDILLLSINDESNTFSTGLINNKQEFEKIMNENANWNADLNCIDTSLITDMSYLFSEESGLNKFNGNISQWNVSNVKNMEAMFEKSKFNQDISNWNMSNVKDMSFMFYNSEFNKDIGNLPKEIKEQTKLKNISISTEYSKLPDKIKYKETIDNIKEYLNLFFKRKIKEKLIYEVQAIDRLDNKQYFNEFKNIFQNDLKVYMKQQKEKYKNKQPDIMKKLILNDMLDIFKDIDNKELITKLFNGKNIGNNIDMNSPA